MENPIFKRAEDFMEARLLKRAGVYPFFRPMSSSDGARVRFEERDLIMIGSNNYLGLTNDERVKKAGHEAIERFGTGCTGSRFLNGNSVIHDQLETELATFLGKQDALVFATGFMTNYASIGTLVEEGDFILSDNENHASIIAGCKASLAQTIVYNHNDIADLRAMLSLLPPGAAKLIVTDAVFSMTGEIVDLPGIVKVKKEFPNTLLLIDDAHGLGVLGKEGRGTSDCFGLSPEVDLICATFSKSFASLGGFIAGNSILIDYFRHKARAFMFSAALPPASVGSALKVLELLKTDAEILRRLWKSVHRAREGYEALDLSFVPSLTPILSLRVGDERKALLLVKELFTNGIFATPVMYPAVPFGHAFIRTSYMATHQKSDIDHVLSVLETLKRPFGLSRDTTPNQQQAHTYAFDEFLNAESPQ
ncbi:pyridoxal phosphate-dependent aminotransferase family protein [Bdellovibrionota bacterium FG-2]